MAGTEGLASAFLESCPAIQWIADSSGIFQRIYGDPAPLFGKSVVELLGQQPEPVWVERFARVFAGENLYFRERRGATLWNILLFPIRSESAVQFAGAVAHEGAAWGSAEAQLRQTVFRVLDTQESDRKAVARFMHDSIGQTMTAIGMRLDLARMDLESGPAEVPAHLSEVQKILGQMMEEVRRYVNALNPSTVDRLGLAPAIERLAARLRGRFHGVLLVHVDPSLRLDKKVASALYRVAHEATENALKHSGCSTLEVTVQSTRTGTRLEVRDDGHGFDLGETPGVAGGMGLLSMEHYAAQAGLELSVVSSREAGTIVRASTTINA